MKLDLKELFDIVGEAKEISYEIPLDALKEYSYDFSAPIAVKGRVFNRAGVVTMEYNASFTIAHTCDRCLSEFSRDYSYDNKHTLVRKTYSEDDELVVCENNVLELDELIISDLLLQLPTKILCREDCKGLCFVCGQDLNKGSCNCSEG